MSRSKATKRTSKKRKKRPRSKGEGSGVESPPCVTPKRAKLGASTSPDDTQPAKIADVKLSEAKHSGLLAKDQERRSTMSHSHHMESPSLPAFVSPPPPTEQDGDRVNQQAISGKHMYSFAAKAQMNKKGTTLKLKSKDGGTSQGKGIDLPNDKDSAVKNLEENLSGNKSSEEEEVVKKKKIEMVPARVTRHRSKKVISESESESSESSEDETLVQLASKLNRGEVLNMADEDTLEDYFSVHSGKAGVTSDHTLAKLSCPKMDPDSVRDALEATSSSSQKDRQALYEEYSSLFPYWLHLLKNEFNVLLYGLGSKQKLLEDFRVKYLQDSCHLVVNGFFPGLTIKQVLNMLSSELLGHTGSFKSLMEQATFICNKLEGSSVASSDQDTPKKLFLIIHNIDGAMLRGEASQNVLSVLAHSSAVHVLASVDHINAPLIWDQRKLSKFNWAWHDVTTFEFYHEETSYENSLLVQQSGSLALSSLTHVTKSLTPNAQGIFELLVNYQLEHKSDKDNIYLGMSFHDCYVRCREKFLVNSDMTLRAQLTEFKDHKLLRTRKGQDGVEYLFIPIDNGTLTQFLEQKE